MADWNELFKQKKFRRDYPAIEVISFIEMLNFTQFDDKNILDLGCGAGRHCHYLASLGFNVYGCDISETGIRYTLERLSKDNLQAHLIKSDMTAIPFKNDFFDAIVSYSVIHHNTIDSIKECVSEIYRTLKPSGRLFLKVKSTVDSNFRKGKQLETNTFLFPSGPEEGIPHHYSDKEELMNLLKNFNIIQLIQLSVHTVIHKEGKVDAILGHWCVVGEKLKVPHYS